MSPAELSAAFQQRYQKTPRLFYAPGHINLIGEHTGVNEGFVMPFVLDTGTMVAAAPRSDRLLFFHSTNLGASAFCDLDAPEEARRGIWLDNVEGMARSLEYFGVSLNGADLLISSDLPSGLASTAALTVSVGIALCALAGEAVDLMTIVRAAHHTENQYVGKHSSVMHPYVAAYGQKDCCLLIDCRWLESRFIPLHLEDLAILLCDSGLKPRELPLRVYSQRRSECRRGVRLIRNVLSSVSSLRDLKPQDFSSIEPILPEPVNRRCRHIVTENQRTLDAAAALGRGDFQTVGNLMFQSHRSLQVDYQVSVPQTNLLVDVARGADGVLGSRMTGGLFGGWTITLMRQSAMHEFIQTTRDAYHKAFGSYPRFMSATSGGGACERSFMAS